MQLTTAKLSAYNRSPIPCSGTLTMQSSYGKLAWKLQTLCLVGMSGPAVAGLPACKDLNIITIHKVIKVPIRAEETKGTCIELQFLQDLSGSCLERNNPFPEMLHQENEDPNSDEESSLSTGSVSLHSSDSEEEIDFVTTEKQRLAVGSIAKGKPPRTGTHLQTLASIKHCSLEMQQQHNYPAPSPLLFKELPAPERTKMDMYLHDTKYSSPNKSSTLSSRPSDIEDEERLRTRNVLKRQRRNELKHCLLALRDEVPELSKNDKASKVVVLRKTAEYVSRLKAKQQKLSAEREKPQKKQQQLRCKLSELELSNHRNNIWILKPRHL
ncbi:myc proto-oncogene protein-like [Heterodontus francisci]|uniref:myc proto-oncogene protein-like n=1 Tax=Heterodontus francisci TaxID=7792 RepID=UPI00355BA269